MTIYFSITKVTDLGDDIWSGEIGPDELGIMGKPLQSVGKRSVVLLAQATYNPSDQSLKFSRHDVQLLNSGSGSQTVFVGDSIGKEHKDDLDRGAGAENDAPSPSRNGGDRDYLVEISQLSKGVQLAGKYILGNVREFYSGELDRGKQRNFTERPDNFWAVRIQPRDVSLVITVRGKPDRFSSTRLRLKSDQHGYTRFKVRNVREAEEALKIIKNAKRKF